MKQPFECRVAVLARYLVGVFWVSTTLGCAIPQVPSRTVYEDPVNFVRLELDANVLPEWPPGHFTHPAQFSHEPCRPCC